MRREQLYAQIQADAAMKKSQEEVRGVYKARRSCPLLIFVAHASPASLLLSLEFEFSEQACFVMYCVFMHLACEQPGVCKVCKVQGLGV